MTQPAQPAQSPGLREALERLLRTAQLLQQNSEGCAVNHYGLDFEQQGLPGWLRDTQASIDEAIAALTAQSPVLPPSGVEALAISLVEIIQSGQGASAKSIASIIINELLLRRVLSASVAGEAAPVAWRWRPRDGGAWIYDPTPEWVREQGDDPAIEFQPLYAAPPEAADKFPFEDQILIDLADEIEQSDGVALMLRTGARQIGIRRSAMVIAALRRVAPSPAPDPKWANRPSGSFPEMAPALDPGTVADRQNLAKILNGWAKAYRDSPEHRFPSDPNAEFFPIDLENAARALAFD